MSLFDDRERTDSTPMKSSESPTGYICPECRQPLNADWTTEHGHLPGCSIASWPLPRDQHVSGDE